MLSVKVKSNKRDLNCLNFKHARLKVSNCDNYFFYVCLMGDNEGLIEEQAVLDIQVGQI